MRSIAEISSALRETEERQEFLLKLTEALKARGDANEIQHIAIQMTGRHLDVASANYAQMIIEQGAEYYVVRRSYAAPGRRSVDGRYPVAEFPGVTKRLRMGRAMVVPEVVAEAELGAEDKAACARNEVGSFVAVPLVKDDVLTAIFAVLDPEPRAWTGSEVALVEEVAERTWAAVERARAEDALRESESRLRVLLAELQHRVRNTLAIVKSITQRTADSSDSVEEMADHLAGRLDSFARVQSAVTRNPDAGVDLKSLITDEMLAHATHEGDHLTIDGPDVALKPKPAETISLAVHELTTNAVKHGALGGNGGNIAIKWRLNGNGGDGQLDFEWVEDGVDGVDQKPARQGFGMELLTRILPYDLSARTKMEFTPKGLRFSLELPHEHLVTKDRLEASVDA